MSIPPSEHAAIPAALPPPALRLLGRMQMHRADGADLLPRARKARAMLAVLAMAAPEPVLRDTLTQLLWSRRAPPQASASLRQTLHALQTALDAAGIALLTDRGLLALPADAVACDARATPGDGLARFGEDLSGLDPAFDRWLDAQRQTRAHPAPRGRAGLRLGVLPFRALDAESAGLSVGLAEEITTALARFRGIFLIASPSLGAIAAQPRAGSADWQALDLDFLLDGTVQHGTGRVRVNARLLDLRGAEELVWAHRFDRPTDDLLTLQDAIAAETVARIDPELLLREGASAARRPPGSATAYDLLLRAIPALYRIEEAGFRAAGDALEQAASRDPQYGPAQAWWAFWHVFLVGQGWAEDPGAAMARAGDLAERAVALDPADARALTIAGHVQAFLHRRIPTARALHERALALNPNLPLAWTFGGLAEAYAGHHDDAIRMIGHALRLSPFDPHAFFFENSLMLPLLLTGQHERVLEHASRAAALHPTLSSTYKGLLAALGHLGRDSEARQARTQLLKLEPGFTLAQAAARSPMRPQDAALYLEGLRRGGLA